MAAFSAAPSCSAPGAAIFMVRSIRHGIGSILKPMASLTDGELSVEIPPPGESHRNRPDWPARFQIFKSAPSQEAIGCMLFIAEAGDQDGTRRAHRKATGRLEVMIGKLVGFACPASTEVGDIGHDTDEVI